jgi:hypothetical protein
MIRLVFISVWVGWLGVKPGFVSRPLRDYNEGRLLKIPKKVKKEECNFVNERVRKIIVLGL